MEGPEHTRDRGLVAAFAVYAVLALAWLAAGPSVAFLFSGHSPS